MSYISTYQFPVDAVKVNSSNFSIDARGDNARIIAVAFAITIVLVGIAAIVKAAS